MQRILAVLLCVAVLFGIVSTCVVAKEYETTEVVMPAPTIDGVIKKGEYIYTTERLDTKTTIYDVLYVPHTYTVTCTGHKVQYYWSYDEEYVYLAYAGEGDMNTGLRFYLNPNVASGQRETICLIVKSSWGELGETELRIYTDDDTYTNGVWSDYVEECASNNWDTQKLNVNEIELKIKRSALGYTDTLGIRSLTAPEGGTAGEVIWGADPANSVIPYQDIWFYDRAGYHVLSFDTVVNPSVPSYTVTVRSAVEGSMSISGKALQKVPVSDPRMSAVTVTANLGYTYSHYTVNGERREESTIALDNITCDTEIILYADYATDELPIINIDTNNTPITSKEDYVDMVFSIENCGEYSDIIGVTGGIRLRGNSTMGYPKKPYRIKFDKKQSLFGLEKAKSWVLLAEYLDPSALHNYTAFTLANDMEGMGFNPTPYKVNVYLDGEYIGLYTLCEQVQENSGRIGNELDVTDDMVDLKDYNFFVAMDDSCVSDNGAEEDLTYIKVPLPDYEGDGHEKDDYIVIELKYPERDAFATEEQFVSYREQLREYMTDLLNALATGDAEYIKQEVNVNSLIDYLLVDQIMDEDDHSFKSFNMYFTNTSEDEAENGKLSFGPVWDYDYSLGVPWQGVPNLHFTVSDRMFFSNIFFRGIMNVPEFEELVKERYAEYMRPAVLEFLENYDALVDTMDVSVALNQERWYSVPEEIGGQNNSSYIAQYKAIGDQLSIKNIDFLKRSLENRIELLDEAWEYSEHIPDPEPAEPEYTEGLEFTLNAEGTEYSVTDYTGTATEVVIPATYDGLPVTSIGTEAFSYCNGKSGSTNLISVEIPNSVTVISNSAFDFCTNLTAIDIPNSVKYIGPRAFAFCTSLTDLVIPESVETICDDSFFGCHGLESISVDVNNPVYHSDSNCVIKTETKKLILGCKNSIIPADESVNSIGENAFGGCFHITSIEVPDNITSIEADAFSRCIGLTSIKLPDSLTSIGGWAFYGCTKLTSIDIPKGVTSIAPGIFTWCEGLESITVDSENTVYHSKGNCIINTETKELVAGCNASVIPDDMSVTSIGREAFRMCEELTSVSIPYGIKSIGLQAFSDCINLETIYYGGSESQWNAIEKGKWWDDCTGDYTVVFAKADEPDEPEDIFDHKDKGQHHNFVGDKTNDAPKLDGDKFDKNKYKEVAGVNKDNVNGNEGFVIGDGINIGHFKVYMTYDDAKIYLAVEIDDKDFKGSESTIFTLRTILGKMEITLAADGTLTDGKGVVADSRVFTSDNGEGGKIVIYALELDRAAVMQINTMSDGDADMFNLSIVNNDDTGVVEYGIEDDEETIGHTFTLSADPNSDIITEDNGASNVTVTGRYVSQEADKVISVNISWEGAVFTYSADMEWDSVNFVDKVVEGSGRWSEEPMEITVTNHSNQAIEASFEFVATVNGITGKIVDAATNGAEVSEIVLVSAESGTASTDTVYFFVTGGELTANDTEAVSIGRITITIAPSVANP